MKKFGFIIVLLNLKLLSIEDITPIKPIDDTILLFRSTHRTEKFRNYLNRQHKNIKFTSETENENYLVS